MKFHLTSASFLAVSLLAACGAGEDAQTNAATSSAPMAAATSTGVFMRAETTMNERMAAVRGSNAADAWMRKMVEHHRGGADLSEALLAQSNVDPQVAARARATATDQRREAEEAQSMIQPNMQGAGSPDAYMQAEQQMSRQMMAATGDSPSEVWVRKMIEHHRGAIAMSEIAVRTAGNEMVVSMAREVIEKQTREIADLERLLQG